MSFFKRKKIIFFILFVVLLLLSTSPVFACAFTKGCPGVNGPSIFSCDGGHACYVDICFTCNKKGATIHSNGHGCVNGHSAGACVCWGCGWNCIVQGQNGGHPHGYPCNPCNHGCKVCHTDAWHCQTCHRAPCICYPAPSAVNFSNKWTTGNVTITATNNNGALGHKFFDKDKKLISETKDGLTTSFEVSENGTYYVTPYNAAGTNPNYSKVEIACIDREAPTAIINGNPVAWQSTDVTLEIVAEDIASGLATEPYSFDGGVTWQSDNKKVFFENTLFDICVIDNLGNVLTIPFEINRIDKILPFAPTTAIVPTADSDGNSVLNYEIIDNVELTQDFVLETWNVDNKVGTLHSVVLSYDEVKTKRRSVGTTKHAKFILGTPTNPNLKIGDRVEGIIYVTDISLNTTQIVIPPIYTDNFAPIVTGVTVSDEWHRSENFATVNSADNETYVVQWGISTINDVNSITEWSTSNYFSFAENGNYFAFAKDINNNVSIGLPFVISHIDKECPVVTGIKKISGYNKTAHTFNVNAEDVGSGLLAYGISRFPIEDNNILWNSFDNKQFTVNNNGKFYLFVKDRVGNISTAFEYIVEYVDNNVPLLSYDVPKNWTKDDVNISFIASDIDSGIDYIILPNGNTISASSFTYTFSQNGIYSFTLFDIVGNMITYNVDIGCIDKEFPTAKHMLDIDEENTVFTIVLNAKDTLSGISHVVLPNGKTTKNINKIHYIITENGEFNFTIVDIAGNEYKYIASVIDTVYKTTKKSELSLSTMLAVTSVTGVSGIGVFIIMFYVAPHATIYNSNGKVVSRKRIKKHCLNVTKEYNKDNKLRVVVKKRYVIRNIDNRITVTANDKTLLSQYIAPTTDNITLNL